MRKILMLFIISAMVLVGCSNTENLGKIPKDVGMAPYELTEEDKYLLNTVGLGQNSELISFNAPAAAKTIILDVSTLNDKGEWDKKRVGIASTEVGLKGTVCMIQKDKGSLVFNINLDGCILSCEPTEEANIDITKMGSAKVVLSEFKELELNKEVPIAIIQYSDSSLGSCSLESYKNPEQFKGVDLVQVVTVTFSDKHITELD